MAISNRKRRVWVAQWADPAFRQMILTEIEVQRADPFEHSELGYWLELDLWSKEEGLLLLTGIDPDSVELSRKDDAFTKMIRWRSIPQPFKEHSSFIAQYDIFTAEVEFGGDRAAYQEYEKDQKRKYAEVERLDEVYTSLKHKLEHSLNALGPESEAGGWRPVAFLAWAASIGYSPEWLEWALVKRRLPDRLDPSPGPFFDADARDYPELLVIAVRAWDDARKGTNGTPKQRVDRFLQDRYPQLTPSTRAAIALVTNWQKAGGRPTKSKE
jgi:hypothetical protein